jgi:type IV secretory pathway VirB10-like protein
MAADERTMRNWGVAAAAGAIGVAALVALQGEPQTTTPTAPAPPIIAAPADPPTQDQPTPDGAAPQPQPPPQQAIRVPPTPPADAKSPPGAKAPPVETAADSIGQAVNPNLEFIVRFDGPHPLARAQALYAAGQHAIAEADARRAVAATPALRGLCFSKFTLGAETVLVACQRVSGAQLKAVSDRWTRRLRAMPGVDYADPNVILVNENPVMRTP